jgi:O-antigen biosynthesis protein
MLFVRDFLTDQVILRTLPPEKDPQVSVILPTFRRLAGGSLERAISSVLSQTFMNFELLVMDDGSTDGSYELIEKFRAQDPRVIHVRHERNSGLHHLRMNEGIELARGQYIAFQFDDDCWRPNALEALLTEVTRHSESVVVGHARCTGVLERILPSVELNLVNLYQENRLANNSVLFPRRLVERYGMYDCHIGMRRLCDWDLWLRFMKHVPFIVVDEIVADVFVGNPDSLGMTVPWDLPLFRFINDIPRNSLLTPERWHDYEVDSLRIANVDLDKNVRRRLYEEQIVPYYLTFRHNFPAIEGFHPNLSAGVKSVLCTKGWYDVSYDIGLNQYDSYSNQRGNYKAYFQPVTQVSSDWDKEADALLLVRTIEDHAVHLFEQGSKERVPVAYYLDDDLLTFHEFGPQFDYVAPCTPCYRNLCDMLSRVDAVWTTNRFIAESVSPFNPRLIPHNGSVPLDSLPTDIRPRDPSQAVRIGYVGSGYRLEEFEIIWEALLRLSHEYGNQLIFEFWGLDVRSLPPLDSPVHQRSFTFSYYLYLRKLKEAGFDILLTPLLDYPRPRLGKAPSKYYQTAVAGALGIFSDVPQYEKLPAGLTCLKAQNTAEGWFTAIKEALMMPPDRFDVMRRRLVAHVKEEFTEKAQIHLHEAAWHATEFHAKTRRQRHADGKPRVLYVLHSPYQAGAEIQMWRRLYLARQYGIEPIVVLAKVWAETEEAHRIREVLECDHIQLEFITYQIFTEPRSPLQYHVEQECQEIRALLERCQPALVHTVTFIPSFGQICQEKGIPHVASLYQVSDTFSFENGRPGFRHCAINHSDTIRYAKRWSQILESEPFYGRIVVSEEFFRLGLRKHFHDVEIIQQHIEEIPEYQLALIGTLQPRKSQLETIEAVGILLKEGLNLHLNFYGYTHFYPEYIAQCERRIDADGLQGKVTFHGLVSGVEEVLQRTDILLSLSTDESFPGTIGEAMAAGVLVVATPVGGIPELVIDGVSGILCSGTSVEAMGDGIRRALALKPGDRKRIKEQARRVARSEFHPHRTASNMLAMYNRAIDLTPSMPEEPLRSPTDTPAPQPEHFPPQIELPAPQTDPGTPFVEPPASSSLSFLPLNGGATYRLTPRWSNWMGLEVLVGFHQQPPRGKLNLRICSRTGLLLRETQVDLSEVAANGWLKYSFAPISNSRSVPFILNFSHADATARIQISVQEENGREGILRRLFRLAGLHLPTINLHCRLWYAK